MTDNERELFNMLDRINTIMWESAMIGNPVPVNSIMEVLEEWADKY